MILGKSIKKELECKLINKFYIGKDSFENLASLAGEDASKLFLGFPKEDNQKLADIAQMINLQPLQNLKDALKDALKEAHESDD